MSYLPCRNPHCKSEGKPHPNCKCYPEMAGGGEVSHYCSEARMHHSDCKYFSLGGVAPEPVDHGHQIAGYLCHKGLHGLLKLDNKHDIEDYDRAIKHGHKHTDDHVKALFSGKDPDRPEVGKAKEEIREWIEKGGITNDVQEELYKQNRPAHNFAKGGEVKKDDLKGVLHGHPIADAYPEQNTILQAAKGRMSSYLNGLKPQSNLPKLAFDHEPDQTMQKKSYDRALHIAADPMDVMRQIKKGTIEPEYIRHLNGLHPEVSEMLQKKLTKQIVESQLKGEKPNSKIRQGLSLLMGTALSSELTPQNIQAAQSTFQSQKPPQAPQGAPAKNKKSASSLTKSDQSFLTANQAQVSRQQKV